ncbi:nitrite reductase (NAD(P)H) small subunit [Streptomyces ipomoeae]|nr:nitrite reductase (NAD(P)H) small subunit [Streptomyces ipomoeae]MDX2823839.1 nitrite reductase (NAD(P)H) small subunit [Streptomyces ipomoeae]MDX2876447.1 nitrite reductase (NAD(P)H) small subunit [Streptomyces ipomoeae]MDX2936749.1 nitrite reductase (NAD(P)H) small subunit [Streptomyces ipomoeae]
MPSSGYTYICECEVLEEGVPRRFEAEGCAVECRLHGSRFDLRTGHPLDPPATRPVPVYPVQIEDGCVYAHVAPRSER